MHGSHALGAHDANRAHLTRGAALASISVAVVLVALKLWASATTNSTAMLGSLADSALDLLASLATLVAVWIAAQPADAEHRFGHGKAEVAGCHVPGDADRVERGGHRLCRASGNW